MDGGDAVIIGNGAVLVGMSERTTPQAAERLVIRLFAAGSARCTVASRCPIKPGVHAPGHGDDDGRRRDLHQVRGPEHAGAVHG